MWIPPLIGQQVLAIGCESGILVGGAVELIIRGIEL